MGHKGLEGSIRVKTFFLIGGYTCNNPGDQAILHATILRIRALFPESRFVIWTEPGTEKLWVPEGVPCETVSFKVLPWLRRPHRLSGKLRQIYRVLYPVASLAFRKLLRHGELICERMRQSECVIFVGGGYLTSPYNVIETHYLSMLAEDAKKRVYYLGHTIGPDWRAGERSMVDDMLGRANVVLLRENFSMTEISGEHKNLWVGMDEASFLPISERGVAQSGAVRVGLNLAAYSKSINYYQLVVEALNRLAIAIKPSVLKVEFIPMETGNFADDRKESASIEAVQGKQFEYYPPVEVGSVADRRARIAGMDLFIGTRFHANVFALSQGVPSLGLYTNGYMQRKITGLFQSYGMERFALPSAEFDQMGEKFVSLFEQRKELRQKLTDCHARLEYQQKLIYSEIFSKNVQ